MRLRHPFRLGFGVLGVVTALCAGALLLQKTQARATSESGELVLRLPRISHWLGGATCNLELAHDDHVTPVADIRCGLLSFPLLLLPGRPGSNVALLYYQLDARDVLVAFELATPASRRPMTYPLGRVVTSTSVTTRLATSAEVDWAIYWLGTTAPRTIRHASIPTVDLGYLRWHAPSSSLV